MQHGDPPDFVVCGALTRDLVPGGWEPGGTVLYAARVAQALGRRVGVVTAAPPDLAREALPDLPVALHPTGEATTFENVYRATGRTQYLRAPGSPIPVATYPDAWRGARVTLLGPVYHEAGADLAARASGLVGLCVQGLLRRVGPEQRVERLPATDLPVDLLRRCAVVVLSVEDIGGGPEAVPATWLEAGRLIVVTAGARGAWLWDDGAWTLVPACHAVEVDPTGAGDTFAAALLVALDDGLPPVAAMRFASAAAALVIERQGPVAPSREQVETRLRDCHEAKKEPAGGG